MEKKIRDNKSGKKRTNRKKYVGIVLGASLLIVLVLGLLLVKTISQKKYTDAYDRKAELLRSAIFDGDQLEDLPASPAGSAGYVVFISVSDMTRRADVYSGSGETAEKAWEAVSRTVRTALAKGKTEAVWVKADIVSNIRTISYDQLVKEVYSSRHEFYRYGVSLDNSFRTALLEAEMNGAKIYEYENGGLDFEYFNNYLRKAGREEAEEFPDSYILFETRGWMCDENDTVYDLIDEGLSCGRRNVEDLDDSYAAWLVERGSSFLLDQINEDGSFVYGMYPRFDKDIENYNIVRHASTIWSLVCRYRMTKDETLKAQIEKTLDYMIGEIIYNGSDTAYLYEEKSDEIKLGGVAVAVIAMTEYMDVTGDDRYKDISIALGNGILSMMDEESGEFYHVLDGNFDEKEEFRTVYYDGEATFALCRLYGLTRNEKWLKAAEASVEHFISADYTQYKDHWVAYSMNEITKYVTDKPEYFEFALRNAEVNLQTIAERDTTYHTYLELLMATFEVYDRMLELNMDPGDFDIDGLLETIAIRTDRQLNGFFYPEYAMYMKNPARIAYTFMVRHDGYRVRIDDIQHNIDGYYMYWKNYDKLCACGLKD